MKKPEDAEWPLMQLQAVDTSDETTQQILDTALELFIEFGLRRATMEDVANRVGIGRATLYRRFKDKDQLLQSVIFGEVLRNLTELQSQINEFRDPLEGLLEAFVISCKQAHNHPLLKRLLSTEPERVLPFLTTKLDKSMPFFRNYLTQQIELARQKNAIRTHSPAFVAEMLLRLLQSLVLTPNGVINPGDDASLRQLVDEYLRPLLTPEST